MTDPRFVQLMYPEPSEAVQWAFLHAIMNEAKRNDGQAAENIYRLIKSYDAARTQAINTLSTQLYDALMRAPAPVYILQKPKEPAE